MSAIPKFRSKSLCVEQKAQLACTELNSCIPIFDESSPVLSAFLDSTSANYINTSTLFVKNEVVFLQRKIQMIRFSVISGSEATSEQFSIWRLARKNRGEILLRSHSPYALWSLLSTIFSKQCERLKSQRCFYHSFAILYNSLWRIYWKGLSETSSISYPTLYGL